MIHVIDDWYIECDELNWISFELRKSKKTGNVTKAKLNYHHNLQMAVKRIFEEGRKGKLRKKDIEILDAISILTSLETDTAVKMGSLIREYSEKI